MTAPSTRHPPSIVESNGSQILDGPPGGGIPGVHEGSRFETVDRVEFAEVARQWSNLNGVVSSGHEIGKTLLAP
jgi:hypothetical protein